jgi:SpoIID/LytB domain protein
MLQQLERYTARSILFATTIGIWCGIPRSFLGTQPALAQAPLNPEMQVGIVQRFGSQPTDKITLQAVSGDQLTLKFATGNEPQTLQASQIQLDIVMEPQTEPKIEERLVLSTHRSFESAEASAQEWRDRGIEVEIAQPSSWEVWAKREVYSTPLLRRLLLDNLKANGFEQPYLSTRVLDKVPQSSWVVNGFRYNRDELQVTSGTGVIVVNQDPYPGGLHLQPNSYGTYTLVNQVRVEDYLRGVVPHEIGGSAPQAAVEAQAILARTYALRNLRRFAIDDYEICADTQCQVYWGWKGTVDRVDQAIAATRGEVLTYNNELIDAVYSSTTGGVTAPFNDVWDGTPRPYLQAVIDAAPNVQVWNLQQKSLGDERNFREFISKRQGFNEVGWDYFRWRVTSSLDALNGELRAYLKGKQNSLEGFKTIQVITVAERSPAGRVQRLQVQTDRGALMLQKDEILRAFDAPNSTLFYLDPLTTSDGKTIQGYAFVGGGYGHGVGMSQTGSYNLANSGWSSHQILSFYYPNTQLQPLNSGIVFWSE